MNKKENISTIHFPTIIENSFLVFGIESSQAFKKIILKIMSILMAKKTFRILNLKK
jgi:hypothetical protein